MSVLASNINFNYYSFVMKSTASRFKLLASRKGMKRFGFKAKAPSGEIFYQNSSAKPIEAGTYFKLENVEYLAARDFLKEFWQNRLVRSQMSSIAHGTIKFKGLKPKPAVFKSYSHPSKELAEHLTQVVERLSKSKASHPRMGVVYFVRDGKPYLYLAMESFVRKELGNVYSKFDAYERLVDSLQLHRKKDVELFKVVLNETAKLAKVGLVVPFTWAAPREIIELGISRENLMKIAHKQIDAFTKMERKEGDARLPKVVVQDIDELEIAKTPKEAWGRSVKNILAVLEKNNPQKRELIESLVRDAKTFNGI